MNQNNKVKIDFKNEKGVVKPLNGVCCAPYSSIMGKNQKHIDKYFKEGNIPYCRLHDCCGKWGGTHFVDIPNIFRDFDADENDPNNYDFHYTDEYIGAIQKSGCEAYYRLGVTIEWGSKKYTANPPKNFGKWARICEHIIMHYNCGWASGFNYNIKYWEIWNEPENPGNMNGKCMWTGTEEEFFDLYRISSRYLKEKFPNIKIGGYGSCGFYAVTRENIPDTHKGFVTFFIDFLKMAKRTESPLDFFSWHIYSADVNEVVAHAKFVRETLDKYGFEYTEVHLNEWNFGAEGKSFESKHTCEGMSFNSAVLCALSNTDYVDAAMYYCFSLEGMYNGFMNQNTGEIDVPWYSFEAYGQLYKLKTGIKTECNVKDFYAYAAKNGDKYAVMAVNYKSDERSFEFEISDCAVNKTVSVKYINDKYNLDTVFAFTSSENMKICLNIEKQTTVLITIE
ncbi:MAG: hypothetical protein SOX82_09280 [Eubacteriales bacterium]|nr:hypothetical protein [Eubacteriales bacterium]